MILFILKCLIKFTIESIKVLSFLCRKVLKHIFLEDYVVLFEWALIFSIFKEIQPFHLSFIIQQQLMTFSLPFSYLENIVMSSLLLLILLISDLISLWSENILCMTWIFLNLKLAYGLKYIIYLSKCPVCLRKMYALLMF